MLSPYPADPTLTTDNLLEVVKGVEDWEHLVYELGVRGSKIREINSHYQSNHHKMEAMLDHYVRHYPTPSWKEVAEALHVVKLHQQADEVTAKYVKGMDVKGMDVKGMDVNHVRYRIRIKQTS